MNKTKSIFLPFLLLYFGVLNAQSLESLTKLYDKTFAPDQPGGCALIQKGEEIVWQNYYGLADIKTKEKINNQTIFNTGSISKTMVSYGILILAEQQKLQIEDPINQYFDFQHPKITQNIQIRHLLAHTSGLPDARKVRSNPDFYLTAKDAENFAPLLEINQLNFHPGERFQYSNPAYNGLALIIEKVALQPWQQFIHEQLFQPAGMNHSKITNGPNPQSGVAHAYVNRNGQYVERDYGEEPTFAAAGNGGIWCSILDLVKYEKAIQANVFVNNNTVKQSRTIFHPTNWQNASTPPNIGCSWFIQEKEDSNNPYGVDIYSHTGSQGGFRAFYLAIPEKNLLYVALFNRPVRNMNDLMQEGLQLLQAANWLN